MGKLTFIGLGLWDEKDITLKGLDAVKAADAVYLETYTSKLFGTTVEKMQQLYGKDIIEQDRMAIEQNPEDGILKEAKEKDVALLVGGDSLIATTHTDIMLRAKEMGIETEVIHNASIYTAAPALSGLQAYKFGKSTTITYWMKNFEPTSFMDVMQENLQKGLHTLLFLDIKADEGRYMSPNEAIDVLRKAEQKENRGIITDDTKLVVISRAGSKKPGIRFASVRELERMDFGGPLHIMVLPGEMHPVELEFLGKIGD